MRRALSLWLPTWATDLTWLRIRRRNSAPAERPRRRARRTAILLTERQGSRELIACRCAGTAEFGVAPGMDLSHARSLIPAHVQTHVEEHRPLRDEAMLQRLAGWALRSEELALVWAMLRRRMGRS